MTVYYQDDWVTLYHGRMEDVLPELGEFDACVTDPPYGETSLAWDRWPDGWPALVAGHTRSMWCFGSMRMFLDRRDEFVGWRMSQDVVWEKHNGSGFKADRFKRVHELALHWYRGDWPSIHHVPPREAHQGVRKPPKGRGRTAHVTLRSTPLDYVDDGTRLLRSVLRAKSVNGRGIHPTEKPPAVLAPLIEYAVPPGGIVLDVFAGSCSGLLTARQLGRRSTGIEADETMCEKAAARLSVPDLFTLDGVS